jgi:5'-deoxynucleotidase YfbR-like HD superfamily hydrolase
MTRLLEPIKDGPIAREMLSLWHEYEGAATAESRYVKQLDKLDMITQALCYEREGVSHTSGFNASTGSNSSATSNTGAAAATSNRGINLDQFFESTPVSLFSDPVLKDVAEQVHQMHRATVAVQPNDQKNRL